MSRERFRSIRFRADSMAKIDKMVEIVADMNEQGLRMTARQLYYQFVSRDLISNSESEYRKMTSLLTNARYAGLIDWDLIEDRGRQPDKPAEWENLSALVASAIRSYRLPRWQDQPVYAELWVEKQALAGVLEPLAREYHVTLMVNKGYSSASAMYEAAQRLRNETLSDGLLCEEDLGRPPRKSRPCIVFYLGDHDPSGEDMVRDIKSRLQEFGVQRLDVIKVALTMAQVMQYKPPPNPAKLSDSRAKAYIKKYGPRSWEVDALPPKVLARLIREAFDAVIDKKKMDKIKKRELADKERLRAAALGK